MYEAHICTFSFPLVQLAFDSSSVLKALNPPSRVTKFGDVQLLTECLGLHDKHLIVDGCVVQRHIRKPQEQCIFKLRVRTQSGKSGKSIFRFQTEKSLEKQYFFSFSISKSGKSLESKFLHFEIEIKVWKIKLPKIIYLIRSIIQVSLCVTSIVLTNHAQRT